MIQILAVFKVFNGTSKTILIVSHIYFKRKLYKSIITSVSQKYLQPYFNSVVLCDIASLSGITSYAENKKEFLENKFGIMKTPSEPTLSCVLHIVDVGKAEEIIIEN